MNQRRGLPAYLGYPRFATPQSLPKHKLGQWRYVAVVIEQNLLRAVEHVYTRLVFLITAEHRPVMRQKTALVGNECLRVREQAFAKNSNGRGQYLCSCVGRGGKPGRIQGVSFETGYALSA
jgi:hypothetical protein